MATIARDVFGLDRAELEHILDTFPTARDYELKDFGEFRTRRGVRLSPFGFRRCSLSRAITASAARCCSASPWP